MPLRQVVDNDPLAAEDVLDVNKPHLESELADATLADFKFRLLVIVNPCQLVLVLGRHLAEYLPLVRRFGFSAADSAVSQRITPDSSPRSVRDHPVAPRVGNSCPRMRIGEESAWHRTGRRTWTWQRD